MDVVGEASLLIKVDRACFARSEKSPILDFQNEVDDDSGAREECKTFAAFNFDFPLSSSSDDKEEDSKSEMYESESSDSKSSSRDRDWSFVFGGLGFFGFAFSSAFFFLADVADGLADLVLGTLILGIFVFADEDAGISEEPLFFSAAGS